MNHPATRGLLPSRLSKEVLQCSYISGHMENAAMVKVGVRELKPRASELVRLVGETGNRIEVTHRGKVVAILVPVESKTDPSAERRTWDSLDSLAAEIGVRWPKTVSAAQAVGAARR